MPSESPTLRSELSRSFVYDSYIFGPVQSNVRPHQTCVCFALWYGLSSGADCQLLLNFASRDPMMGMSTCQPRPFIGGNTNHHEILLHA